MQIGDFIFDFPLFLVAGKQTPSIDDPSGRHIPIYTEQLLAEREMKGMNVYGIQTTDHLSKFIEMYEPLGYAGVCFDPVRQGETMKGTFAAKWSALRVAMNE